MIQDIESESIVIGTLLNLQDAVVEYMPVLTLECFTDPTLIQVFASMRRIYDKGSIPNVASVFSDLATHGSQVSFDAIDELVRRCQFANFDATVNNVTELAVRRSLFLIARKLEQAAENRMEPLDRIYTASIDTIEKAFSASSDSITTIGEAVEKAMTIVNDNVSGKEHPSSVSTPTGFAKLDETGGFHAGDLIIIAGDTSQGKTSFSVSVANNMMENHARTAYFSMEMRSTQLAQRIMAMRSKVSSSHIAYSKLEQYDYGRVSMIADKLKGNSCILLDDNTNSNIDKIISSIRRMHHKFGIVGAFVDYLQILSTKSTRESTEQMLADMARRLKNLALELNIFIVALSQLNRDRNNPEPSLERVLGSGGIAAAADQVIFVYRPEYYGKPMPSPFSTMSADGAAVIDIAKGRNTGVGKFVVSFVPQLTLFVDEAPGSAPATATHSGAFFNNNDMPF